MFVEAEKKWMSFTADATSCYRVQGVLDDYRAQLGVPRPQHPRPSINIQT